MVGVLNFKLQTLSKSKKGNLGERERGAVWVTGGVGISFVGG
jgi:hypothetical protein